MNTITLSIETNAGTYQHGYHLGTIESVALDMAAHLYHHLDVELAARLGRAPKGATYIVTVALKRNGKMLDCYDGTSWMSEFYNFT